MERERCIYRERWRDSDIYRGMEREREGYIYIYGEREREREGEKGRERGREDMGASERARDPVFSNPRIYPRMHARAHKKRWHARAHIGANTSGRERTSGGEGDSIDCTFMAMQSVA